MKKVVLSCLVGLGLSVAACAADYEMRSGDVKNFYNFKDKKCDTLAFNEKADIIKDIRNGKLIIDNKYANDAGETYVVVGEWENGKEFEMILTSNYNECRFYEDLVIKKMDVKAAAYMDKSVKK